MKSEKLSDMWKVPFRQVYCETFRQWLATTILCHVVYRLDPPALPNLPGD
jgi:hypothetical protein